MSHVHFMSNMSAKTSGRITVSDKIRKYALRQIRSMETLHTAVMLGLLILMTALLKRHGINPYSAVFFILFLGLSAFGLYETIPALIMYFAPYSSPVFRFPETEEGKRKICEQIDSAYGKPGYLELTDLTATEQYAVLEGKRNLEVIRWADMAEVIKKEYPFRQKNKGVFYLYFIDSQGKRHELELHSGEAFNPLRELSRIFVYIRDFHPEIRLSLSETDEERIREMQEETAVIRNDPGL